MKCNTCGMHFKPEELEQHVCRPMPEPTSEIYTNVAIVPEPEPEPEQMIKEVPYQVQILSETLYCHQGPGVNYPVVELLHQDQIYLITTESFGAGSSLWGEISGGWIPLDKCGVVGSNK